MKKNLLSLVASLLFACGLAATASESITLALHSYDQCLAAAQHCDALVSTQAAGPVMQLPSLEGYRSPLLRSDMRVASAGLVFNRTVSEILSESTAPS